MIDTKMRREASLDGASGSSSNDRDAASWKLLWKILVPGKFRMLLWRLAKKYLPTEDVRAHRNMSTSSVCGMCGAKDSWRHSLLEYLMARCIWAIVDGELAKHLCKTTEPSAKQWIFTMIDTLSHVSFVRLAVTPWAIWWATRKAVHEAIY